MKSGWGRQSSAVVDQLSQFTDIQLLINFDKEQTKKHLTMAYENEYESSEQEEEEGKLFEVPCS